MRPKEFKALKGWIDYDRPYLHLLTKSQEVRYFRDRIEKVVVVPLRKMHEDIVSGTSLSNPVLCFGTCICCSIEALGKFHTGVLDRGNSGNNFKSFVRRYMDPKWCSSQLAGKYYVDLLWDNFRNGLAHGFTIKSGGLEKGKTYFQIAQIGGVRQLEVDPTRFLRDFRNASRKFIAELMAASAGDSSYLRFHHAFRGVFILGL
jgi:hypothetical protein